MEGKYKRPSRILKNLGGPLALKIGNDNMKKVNRKSIDLEYSVNSQNTRKFLNYN